MFPFLRFNESKHGRFKAEKIAYKAQNHFRRREFNVMSAYKKVIDQIQASDQFKDKIQKEMMEYEEKERRGIKKG
jgi:hypothetical protein